MPDDPEGFNPSSRNPQRGSNPGGQGGAGSSGPVFDLRAITPGGLMAVVGGLLYFVFSFFPWYTVNNFLVSGTANAWSRASGVWSVLVFLVVALAFAVKALRVVPPKIHLEVLTLGLVVLGDIFFLVAFFDVPELVSRGWGLWVALIVGLVINVGAVLQFIKVGGLVSAQRGLRNMQQRASGAQGGYPPQPGEGDYPPQGGDR